MVEDDVTGKGRREENGMRGRKGKGRVMKRGRGREGKEGFEVGPGVVLPLLGLSFVT